MSEVIRFYKVKDPHGYMSNFSRDGFEINGIAYATSEHYFQSKKAEGTPYEEALRNAKGPAECARLGRSRDFKLRADWEQVKDDVMMRALRAKFKQHPELAEQLVATGDSILVEATSDDYYWGEGTERTGKNMLGILLMQLRNELRSSS